MNLWGMARRSRWLLWRFLLGDLQTASQTHWKKETWSDKRMHCPVERFVAGAPKTYGNFFFFFFLNLSQPLIRNMLHSVNAPPGGSASVLHWLCSGPLHLLGTTENGPSISTPHDFMWISHDLFRQSVGICHLIRTIFGKCADMVCRGVSCRL